nr:ribonuclease H-like domain-containing protein [Tanacetum cinerariifolium]
MEGSTYFNANKSNQIKIINFENASKSLDKLIGSQISDNSRTSLGFTSYNAVAPPPTGLFAPPSIDLSNFGLEEFQHSEFKGYGPKDSKSVCIDTSNEIKKDPDAPIIEDWVSDSDEDESEVMVCNQLPLTAGLFAPPSIDLSNFGLEEFQHSEFKGYGPKDSKSVCVDTLNEIKKDPDAPIIEDWVSDSDEDESEQNRVAERKNRTLIEAVRTMLTDSKLPTTFWDEAVNTACYVQNRVLVVKPHYKTPYELFKGRSPALSFMRPCGCHVIILNTLDQLGKFCGT